MVIKPQAPGENGALPLDRATHDLSHESVVILGGGPTGLGAARRLTEIGDVEVRVFDENPRAGGLSSSFVDDHGFTWDIGGHVQFSHYRYFDDLMNELLADEWLEHMRESWIWMRDRFIPYPLQNNIHLLPRDEFLQCIRGLIESMKRGTAPLGNFHDWIEASFGAGLAEIFLLPYNFKVWAHQPASMSYHWVGERVATVDLMRVISNALDGKEEKNWGPNNRFRFPLRGGTGQIWRTLASRLPEGVFRPNHRCVRIETAKRMVHFEDGSQEKYDRLISTIPLDVLISLADVESLKTCVQKFRHSTVHVVGIGLKGAPPPHLKSKCWIYFPEDNCSFYRATVFSNYSPHNVPDITRFWSLMVEVSESPYKAVDRAGLLDSVMGGLLATKLIGSPNEVASVWMHSACHGYPTPFLGRDRLVPSILAELEKLNIYSRGRFGGWKYEVSNQDHSLMQGVELVSRLAFGTPEVTYLFPEVANRGSH
ncbi:MAG: protoporphyrinogen/coproporphyrinogen oxidase [Terriglobia bacterium]